MLKKKKIFNLEMNTDPVARLMHCTANGDVVRVSKGGVIDVSLYAEVGKMTPINNFIEEMDNVREKRFYLQRTFSLGDMLMLVPLYRILVELGYEPYIRTKPEYLDLLSALRVHHQDSSGQAKGYGINLDYVVERDHWDSRLQKKHRMEIYHMAVGLPFSAENLDFSYEEDRFPENVEEEPYIVFQGRGAVERRGLPVQTIQDLLYFLNMEKVKVIYIGEKISGLEGLEGLTDLRFVKGSITELFTLIANAKILISMDSAPLWLSHFTKTPVIALLGPGRDQERIALHPLYPEGAMSVRLENEIGCKPCFEQSEKCEHRFDCMKLSKSDRIYQLIRPTVLKFWKVQSWRV